MNLQSPNYLWFLFLVPLLILLYVLKQRFQEREISSLYLWHQVIMDSEASTPFQKLKKSLLLLIQLLILLFLIFALCQPFIPYSKSYQNIIIVIDTSGSMNAAMGSSTRIEEAKNRAEAMVKSLNGSSRVTLITAGKNSKVVIANSESKQETLEKIRNVHCENSKGSIENVYSLVKSMSEQMKSYKAIYYTDRKVALRDLNAQVVNTGINEKNVSLDYISYSREEGKIDVLVRVKNHSNQQVNEEVCIYGEEKVIGLKDIKLRANELKTVYFTNLPANSEYIYAELSKTDGLKQDNRIYTVLDKGKEPKILLDTNENVFIEKAINSIKNVKLYKTSGSYGGKGNYDLYIFDGHMPSKLPTQGNIIIINSSGSKELFQASGEHKGGELKLNGSMLTRYMEDKDIAVSKFRTINTPYWGRTIFKVLGEQAGFEGKYRGQKIISLGFDLHDTNLVLTANFPIFMNNVITYMVSSEKQETLKYYCGDAIKLDLKADAKKVTVIDSEGKKHSFKVKHLEEAYENTDKPGIYKIIQYDSTGASDRLVAVNFPTSESNLSAGETKSNIRKMQEANGGGLELQKYLIYAVLLLIMAEWFVYKRS